MAKCPCENRLLDCAGVNSEAAKLHFATEHVYTSVGNPTDRSLINRSHYQATFMYASYAIHITTLYVLYSVLLDIHRLSKTTILRVSLAEPKPPPTACIAVPHRSTISPPYSPILPTSPSYSCSCSFSGHLLFWPLSFLCPVWPRGRVIYWPVVLVAVTPLFLSFINAFG